MMDPEQLRAEVERLRRVLKEVHAYARDGHAKTAPHRLKRVSLLARDALGGKHAES